MVTDKPMLPSISSPSPECGIMKPQKNYVIKRTAQGKRKREINRCLKRYIVCEIYRELCVPKAAKATP